MMQMNQKNLECLRCKAPMKFMGEVKFHEGSRAMPFLFGNVGELMVKRERFDSYACTRCGHVEFFLPMPNDEDSTMAARA